MLTLLSARIALASRNRRVGRRFASFRQIVDCFIGFITLNPLLHERFRLFDVFSSGCIGHKWSLWMGTQEDCYKTFCVHRTHYDSRLLPRKIRVLLNRLGNCAVVLWMYFHYKKKVQKSLIVFEKSRTRSCWTDCNTDLAPPNTQHNLRSVNIRPSRRRRSMTGQTPGFSPHWVAVMNPFFISFQIIRYPSSLFLSHSQRMQSLGNGLVVNS